MNRFLQKLILFSAFFLLVGGLNLFASFLKEEPATTLPLSSLSQHKPSVQKDGLKAVIFQANSSFSGSQGEKTTADGPFLSTQAFQSVPFFLHRLRCFFSPTRGAKPQFLYLLYRKLRQ